MRRKRRDGPKADPSRQQFRRRRRRKTEFPLAETSRLPHGVISRPLGRIAWRLLWRLDRVQ